MRSSITLGGTFRLAATAVAIGMAAILSTPHTAAASNDTYRMDTSFSTVLEADNYSTSASQVKSSLDEGFFVIGDFSRIGGQYHLYLAKFKADGTVDANFNRGTGFNGSVDCLEVLADGRLLVAGTFTSFNGTACPGFARLNADGSLDTSFVPNSSINSPIKIAVQRDGRILCSARVYTAPSNPTVAYLNLGRINADGSADPTFTPPTIALGQYMTCFVPLSDGKILVGGTAFTIGNTTYNHFIRLNADGSLDTTFAADASFTPSTMAQQSDGKIVAGGHAWGYFGPGIYVSNFLVRLNTNGSTDSSFHPTLDIPFLINAVKLQSDGKVLVGGDTNTMAYNRSTSINLARLNADGTADTTFAPTSLNSLQVQSVTVQADNHIVACGFFYNPSVSNHTSVLRLTPTGASEPLSTGNSRVPASTLQAVPLASGKFLVGGYFMDWVNGATHHGLARLNADGSPDTAFDANGGFDGVIDKLVAQPDGKTLVLGRFISINGVSCGPLIRMNANGTQDTSFTPSVGTIVSETLYDVVLQADGKILVGGFFYQGVCRRLNADGTTDTTFAFPVPTNTLTTEPYIYSIAVQPDGKILIGGAFHYSFGTNDTVDHANLVRLNSNGSIDPTFNPGTGPDNAVAKIILQANGQILISGFFDNYSGTARKNLARVNPLGNLDTTFDAGTQLGTPRILAVQSDQRPIVSSPTLSNGFVRLNTDGSIDTTFKIYDFNGSANSVSIMDNGRLLITDGIAISSTVTQLGVTLLKPDTGTNPPDPGTPNPPQPTPTNGGSGGGAPGAWFVLSNLVLLASRCLRGTKTLSTERKNQQTGTPQAFPFVG